MPLLPAKENFADLRESCNKLLHASTNEDVQRLAGILGMMAYRCDLLEREVERVSGNGLRSDS
jgi:hypothetical protein